MKYRYHGFTIVELLGAMIIISLSLLSILWLLRVAITYTNKTKQETIAINLAREGIEWVYNRRNTNWLRQSWEKDRNRLNTTNEIWPSARWFQWSGRLHELTNQYITWYGQTITFTSQGNLTGDSILWIGSLELWFDDFIWWASPDVSGRFYRAIIGEGLYQKDTSIVWWVLISCVNWDDTYNWIDIDGVSFPWECNDSHPKEYRFCSRVEYEKNFQWKIELCGSITNYQE